MKKSLIAVGAAMFILSACNYDSNSGTSNSDTATHNADGTHTDNSTHATDSANNNTMNTTTTGSSASLMDVMNKSMQEMKGMQSTGNPDNDFAALMKMHHMSAIEMAQVELAQGQDPQIKQMAQKMLDDQQKEVAEFNSFLSGHNAHGGGDAFFKQSMAMMTKMDMNMDMSGSIDKQFVQMMIPHHQSAVDMSQAYIKQGAHEEKLKTMANNIISSQKKEIGELQAWLNKNK